MVSLVFLPQTEPNETQVKCTRAYLFMHYTSNSLMPHRRICIHPCVWPHNAQTNICAHICELYLDIKCSIPFERAQMWQPYAHTSISLNYQLVNIGSCSARDIGTGCARSLSALFGGVWVVTMREWLTNTAADI